MAGTYTLVFTVSDGKGENNAVYTVTLMLENSTETKTMTVQLPANLSPKFYVTNGFDNGTDVLGAEIATQEKQTADGVSTYTVAYPINATHISVRTDAWGGMAMDAAENSFAYTDTYLLLVSYALNKPNLESERRDAYCNWWADGIDDIFNNGSFLFDDGLLYVLFRQVDSNASQAVRNRIKHLILQIMNQQMIY